VAHLGDSPALARANADLAYAYLNDGRDAEAIELLHEAQRLATELDLPDVLSDALNTEACALANAEDPSWYDLMRRGIEVAREHELQNPVGRGYANMHSMLVIERRYAEATHWFREGSAYCEEHDIATYGTCLLSSQAEVELGIGEWDRAETTSRQILARAFLSPANRLPALQTLGVILGRRGDAEAMALLDRAVESVLTTGEPGWVAGTVPCRAETHWLLGDEAAALDDLRKAAEVVDVLDGWHRGLVATWLQRLGETVDVDPGTLPEPYRLSMVGDHDASARAWERLLCPWEAALARYDAGTEPSLRAALAGFEALGAEAAVRLCRRRLRELGVRSVPVGARAATREHPAGLTPRESEVLDLIVQGLRNEEIAARLVISVKTVDHHVSSVLGKLGVSSRGAAASEARRLGLTAVAT
jgi:DNA-binding CsgD family transcriptional regulator/tetratricopeptide (TPR) repeat protein